MGRAKVNTTEGFVKILSSTDTDQILGVHIIGDQAGNMIGEAAVAMEFEATSEDLPEYVTPILLFQKL